VTTVSKEKSGRQSTVRDYLRSNSGFLTNDLRGKRQLSLEPKLGFKISQFEADEKKKFLKSKDVSERKKAGKLYIRGHKKRNVEYEGKTSQKAIQIIRRNYKKKRGKKMKKKSILRAPQNRKYRLGKSESIPSEINSKGINIRQPRCGRPFFVQGKEVVSAKYKEQGDSNWESLLDEPEYFKKGKKEEEK
jgi:hypothetical protein